MKKNDLRTGWLILAAAMLTPVPLTAQGVILEDGRQIAGQIVDESERWLTLQTENYGELRFSKLKLTGIVRSGPMPGGASAGSSNADSGRTNSTGGASANPFGGGGGSNASASTANPFGGGGGGAQVSANPFGSGGNTNTAGNTSGSSNPFGGAADPFGGGGNTNPGGNSGGAVNPFGGGHSNSGGSAGGSANPFGGSPDPFGGGAENSGGSESPNPFGGGNSAPANPFGGGNANPGGSAGGSTNPSGGSPDPFGGGNGNNGGSASPNPFGGGGSGNPAPANPFGGGNANPGGSAGGSANPFGAQPSAPARSAPSVTRRDTPATPNSDQSDSSSGGLPSLSQFKAVQRQPPEVAQGYDGIVFGLHDPWSVEIGNGEGSTDWQRVQADTDLRVGQHVRTREVPAASLRLREKQDVIRLPQESHIELVELSTDAEEVSIYLHKGSIWSDVASRATPESFVVETPELTAGVRGTRFGVSRANGGARVSVQEGEVVVRAKRTGVYVPITSGQSAVVNADGQILDLVANPVDEQAIWEDWQTWALEASAGTGTLAAGASPIGNLTQQIAQDNTRWTADMEEYRRTQAINQYMDKISEYAAAFEQFAQDTGVIPEDDDAWTVVRFDTGIPGWNGPYVDGPVPPMDPWRKPLQYKRETGRTGKVYAKIYSWGANQRDDGGLAGRDMMSLATYFDLPRFENDPEINPQ